MTEQVQNQKFMACVYCGKDVLLQVLGDYSYPYQQNYGPVYICTPCKAWVGCHSGTTTPMGTVAKVALRKIRSRAHKAFDPIWQSKMVKLRMPRAAARRSGYAWLAKELGAEVQTTHIGHMDIDQCRKVIEVCKKFFAPVDSCVGKQVNREE